MQRASGVKVPRANVSQADCAAPQEDEGPLDTVT
jgi:hypothetical protein